MNRIIGWTSVILLGIIFSVLALIGLMSLRDTVYWGIILLSMLVLTIIIFISTRKLE